MEWTSDILDQIDRYISGKATEEEQAWIESQIASDDTFRAKVEEVRQIQTSTRLSKLKDQFSQFQTFEKEIENSGAEEGYLANEKSIRVNDMNNTPGDPPQDNTSNIPGKSDKPKVEYSKLDTFYAGIRVFYGKQLIEQMEGIEETEFGVKKDSGTEQSPDQQINRKTKIGNSPEKTKPSVRRIRIISIVSVAAMFGLIVLSNLDFLNRNWSQDTFDLYYESFNVNRITRSTQNQFSKAEELFSLGNYEEALEELNNQEQKTASDHLLEGFCYAEMGDYTKSIEIFSRNQADKYLPETQLWYVALLNLKQNNLKEAAKYLNKIPSESSYKKKERKKLLKQIKLRTLFRSGA